MFKDIDVAQEISNSLTSLPATDMWLLSVLVSWQPCVNSVTSVESFKGPYPSAWPQGMCPLTGTSLDWQLLARWGHSLVIAYATWMCFLLYLLRGSTETFLLLQSPSILQGHTP